MLVNENRRRRLVGRPEKLWAAELKHAQLAAAAPKMYP
jgi:hypothetical protein